MSKKFMFIEYLRRMLNNSIGFDKVMGFDHWQHKYVLSGFARSQTPGVRNHMQMAYLNLLA